MDRSALFFDIWCASYDPEGQPRWVEPKGSLTDLVILCGMGLVISGCVNGQDDYVWKLTPKGELVGAALNREILEMRHSPTNTAPGQGYTHFDVILESCAHRLNAMKALRTLLNVSLEEARLFVSLMPAVLGKRLSWEDAQSVKSSLEAVGGKVQVRPSKESL